MTADPRELAAVVSTIADALIAHRVPYFITGSLASSVHGEFRATNDIDIVADFRLGDVPAMIAQLSGAFLVDRDVAARAVATGGSFNLIHHDSFLKVDLFAAVGEFEQSALTRTVPISIPGAAHAFAFASVEDVILAKLRWYDLGGRESAVQWRDITRLVSLNREQLDLTYLRRWAIPMGTDALLATAMQSS